MSGILKGIIGFIFVFSGVAKLTDKMDAYAMADLKQMRGAFQEFSTVFPLRPLGYSPDPVFYCKVVGWVELVAALLMLAGPRPLNSCGSLTLLVTMAGAAQTLICLGKYTEAPVPITIFLALLYTHMAGSTKQKDD